METQGWIFLSFICHQQTNTACVLLLCDTWTAVGGRCNVFIHSLVSSQTGTEFHYSGIKRNRFCPPRTVSLWVFSKVQRMLLVYPVLVSVCFSCRPLQCSLWVQLYNHGVNKMLLKYTGFIYAGFSKINLTFPFDNNLKTINFNTSLNVNAQLGVICHEGNYLNL